MFTPQAVTSGKSELTGWGMRNLVTDANNVRWNNAALRSDNGPQITHFDAQNNVLGFLRWDNRGNVVLTVVNLSDNQWDQAVYGINVGGNGALTRCNACLRVSERIE